MEKIEAKDMKVRIKVAVDTSADNVAVVLSILTNIVKEQGLENFFVDEIRYLGPYVLADPTKKTT